MLIDLPSRILFVEAAGVLVDSRFVRRHVDSNRTCPWIWPKFKYYDTLLATMIYLHFSSEHQTTRRPFDPSQQRLDIDGLPFPQNDTNYR